MKALDVAVMIKIAREEAGKVRPSIEQSAAAIAEKVARSIIPLKGDAGYTPVKGKDYRDGDNGYSPKKDVDYFDGKDGVTPIKGKDYRDGKDGVSAAAWHLTVGAPDDELGAAGDFALDGKGSNVHHKKVAGWEFVVHLKAEVPHLQMQPPRAYSPEQIRDHASTPSVRYTAIDTTTTDKDNVIIATGLVTITLHTPTTTEPLPPKRIKRVGDDDVTVTTVDAAGYVLNINYQAVDVQWTGTEWISL
jgi:hypothetical protein